MTMLSSALETCKSNKWVNGVNARTGQDSPREEQRLPPMGCSYIITTMMVMVTVMVIAVNYT